MRLSTHLRLPLSVLVGWLIVACGKETPAKEEPNAKAPAPPTILSERVQGESEPFSAVYRMEESQTLVRALGMSIRVPVADQYCLRLLPKSGEGIVAFVSKNTPAPLDVVRVPFTFAMLEPDKLQVEIGRKPRSLIGIVQKSTESQNNTLYQVWFPARNGRIHADGNMSITYKDLSLMQCLEPIVTRQEQIEYERQTGKKGG